MRSKSISYGALNDRSQSLVKLRTDFATTDVAVGDSSTISCGMDPLSRIPHFVVAGGREISVQTLRLAATIARAFVLMVMSFCNPRMDSRLIISSKHTRLVRAWVVTSRCAFVLLHIFHKMYSFYNI